MGAPLFVRTAKGVDLTEAGHTLLAEVPNLLLLAQRAKERTRRAGQGLTGQLDVGLFGSGVLDVIPRMLARFHAERPEVRIVLHNLTKAEQLQALRERRISVGFNRLVPLEPDLVVETVLREPLVVALHESHPLATRQRIRIPDLLGEPVILYPNVPMPGLAQEVAEAFRQERTELKVEQEVEDVLTAVALVASGFGLAVTTRSAASLRLPGVVFRPLSSRYLRDLELSCLYRRADPSPVLAAFLKVVHDYARSAKQKVRPA
jgi:LysR family transcriptional regulator, benzoate and cis,cis-muconate-responsive activator of ben and cat genes